VFLTSFTLFFFLLYPLFFLFYHDPPIYIVRNSGVVSFFFFNSISSNWSPTTTHSTYIDWHDPVVRTISTVCHHPRPSLPIRYVVYWLFSFIFTSNSIFTWTLTRSRLKRRLLSPRILSKAFPLKSFSFSSRFRESVLVADHWSFDRYATLTLLTERPESYPIVFFSLSISSPFPSWLRSCSYVLRHGRLVLVWLVGNFVLPSVLY